MTGSPTVHLYEFNISESSPEPTRHITNGSPAYVKTLGSGTQSAYLEFDNLLEQDWYYGSKTKVFIFRTSSENYRIYNMRYYVSDQSALSPGSSYLQFAVSGVWAAYPAQAASGQTGMIEVPAALPGAQNLFMQDDSTNMSGVLDPNVSQYIYVSLMLGAAFPNGRYGAGDIGSFGRMEHRVLFDYIGP